MTKHCNYDTHIHIPMIDHSKWNKRYKNIVGFLEFPNNNCVLISSYVACTLFMHISYITTAMVCYKLKTLLGKHRTHWTVHPWPKHCIPITIYALNGVKMSNVLLRKNVSMIIIYFDKTFLCATLTQTWIGTTSSLKIIIKSFELTWRLGTSRLNLLLPDLTRTWCDVAANYQP